MLPEKTSFVKPYFIEKLGEEGLTAHDVAISLGVDFSEVLRKIRRNNWQSKVVQNWRVMAYTMSNDSNGLSVETFAFNIRSAKAFIARWNNDRGDSYLDFLFDCERAATEILPKVMEENRTLKQKLAALEKSVTENSKELLKSITSRKGMLLAPIYEETLFGLQTRWKLVHKSELSKMQILKSKAKSIADTMFGLTKKGIENQDEIEKEEIKIKNNLFFLAKERPKRLNPEERF